MTNPPSEHPTEAAAGVPYQQAGAATVAREDRHVWQGWGDNVLRCTRCGVKDFSLGSRAPLGPCPQAKASGLIQSNPNASRLRRHRADR